MMERSPARLPAAMTDQPSGGSYSPTVEDELIGRTLRIEVPDSSRPGTAGPTLLRWKSAGSHFICFLTVSMVGKPLRSIRSSSDRRVAQFEFVVLGDLGDQVGFADAWSAPEENRASLGDELGSVRRAEGFIG